MWSSAANISQYFINVVLKLFFSYAFLHHRFQANTTLLHVVSLCGSQAITLGKVGWCSILRAGVLLPPDPKLKDSNSFYGLKPQALSLARLIPPVPKSKRNVQVTPPLRCRPCGWQVTGLCRNRQSYWVGTRCLPGLPTAVVGGSLLPLSPALGMDSAQQGNAAGAPTPGTFLYMSSLSLLAIRAFATLFSIRMQAANACLIVKLRLQSEGRHCGAMS